MYCTIIRSATVNFEFQAGKLFSHSVFSKLNLIFTGLDSETKRVVNTPSAFSQHLSGINLLSNSGVNLITNVIMSLIVPGIAFNMLK